jgi:putative PEP-CTERM system histidine kinase
MELAVATYSAAAIAFAALTVALLRGAAMAYKSMAVASACTAMWSASVALSPWTTGELLSVPSYVLEVGRDAAWLAFLADALLTHRPDQRSARLRIQLAILAVATPVAALGLVPSSYSHWISVDQIIIGHLLLAVFGLALTENLFRNVPSDERWNLKFLCFGVGALFGYDFFLYSQALLFRQIDADLFAARGITNALSVPLLLVSLYRRSRGGRAFVISHRLAFHSAALLGAGLYLLVMAGAGYYIREYGGTWGGVLQVVFLFGTFLVLVVSLTSGAVRGYLKTLVAKYFLQYKYDYREEWLRFIRTVGEAEESVHLPERVIQAVCDVVDSPEGGLWLLDQQGDYALRTKWNLSRWDLDAPSATVENTAQLAAFLARTHSIVNIDELRGDPSRYEGTALPSWIAQISRAWLIVPLIHHDQLRGFIVLGQSRAPKDLDWEDYDLLRTIGQQAASYLVEYELSEALADARQFEAFNKRFAFVIHDIKNLVSQLSLIVSNAARHRHDAAFQDDVIKTVEGSVEKMRRLLLQLHRQPSSSNTIEIDKLVQTMVSAQSGRGPQTTLEVKAQALKVTADEDRLRRVMGHLLQNAAEAAKESGKIQVRLSSEGSMAVIEVEDNGPGMDPQFVRDKLFRPFKTTKGEGYGIGVYETNEYARALGGRLDVFSQPGRGTIMKMSLPLASPAGN